MLLMATAGIILPSCSDDSPWSGSDTEGGIVLSLESDGQIVRRGTRADDTTCPIVPDGNAFGISLSNTDKTYSKTWKSLEAFNAEKGFPIGDYKIEAVYGDLNHEGFELPYYKGTNDVHVAPGSTTDVKVVATLANAMVSVRYTDAFTSNFPHYSTSVQTPGHEWLVFAQGENRPGFIDPTEGTADIALTMTNKRGETVTVNPAKFVPQARHHYVITINATGNVSSGDLALDIQFDDEVVAETVTISLGDELFTAPAPEIRPKDFTDKQELSLLEYDEITQNPQFDIYAFGGFSEVKLNVVNDGSYAPTFGSSVQLVGAEPVTQTQLANEGVVVSGLFKNADKMAVVNVKKFIEQLPAGNYSVELQAKDLATRLSDPITLKAKVGKVDYTLASGSEIGYMANEIYVDVASNSEQIKNKITFKASDSNNRMVPATIKSVSPVTRGTRADLPYAYRFCLVTPTITTPTVNIQADYGKIQRTAQLSVNEPEYTVDVDAFARFVVFRINGTDDMRKYVLENLMIYNGTAQVSPGNITRDIENGMITVRGLSANSTYSAMKGKLGNFEKEIGSFTTEADTDVPNGNFSNPGTALTYTDLQVGGVYGVSSLRPDYTNKVNLNLAQASGWATLNALTFYTGSTCKNSWFMVPSTYVTSEKQALIRSVGYSHEGTLPARTYASATKKIQYNTNSPKDAELTKQAGELFLGTYAFSGTATRSNGISFGSRPSILTFDYKYTTQNGEKAEVEIYVMDADGNVISSKKESLSSKSTMGSHTVALPSYPFGKKAAKLYVCFRSTESGVSPKVNIPTGSELKEWEGSWPISPYVHYLDENTYHTMATGSVLILDNVKLGYETAVTVTPSSKRRK